MAKTTQEKLLDDFAAVAGPAGGTTASSAAQALIESSIASLTGSTGPAAGSNSASSGGGVTASSVVKTVLESGLGLVPLIGGLIGLFTGGDSNPQPALTKYVMPPALDFEAAETAERLSSINYDQMGTPRAIGGAVSQSSTAMGDYAGGSGAPPAQVTADAQSMDAQWFLDHSADIAAAVRNAMLNLNSINDVVNDL